MDGTIDRRKALKLLGGLAITGSLAGCTSEESASQSPTSSAGSPSTADSTAQSPATQSTDTPTATPTQTETPTSTATSTTTSGGGAGQTVTFKSKDGRTIKGTLYGSGNCAMVFAHGAGHDRSDWATVANTIAEAGYTALTVSLNYDKRAMTPQTLVGAVSYLREQQNAETVICVGSGEGASATVQASTVAGTNIAGSVLIAPGRAVGYAPELSGQLLFVVGKGDDEQYVRTTKTMHQRAPKPKRLVTLPTDKHGLEIFNTKQGSKLTDLISEFATSTCSG